MEGACKSSFVVGLGESDLMNDVHFNFEDFGIQHEEFGTRGQAATRDI